MKRLDTSSSYRSFMRERDGALEKILQTNQLHITDITQHCFGYWMMLLVSAYPRLQAQKASGHVVTDLHHNVESDMNRFLQSAVHQVYFQILRLRRNAYVLSNIGQAEAIGRAQGARSIYKIDSSAIMHRPHEKLKSGVDLKDKISVAFTDVKRKLVGELHRALMLDETVDEAKIRFYRALPKRRFFDEIPDALKRSPKPMRESAKDEKVSMATGFVNDDDWNSIVEDYKSDYVPDIRGPEEILDLPTSKDQKTMYAWELERDVSQAFVEDVRQGQVDAARINGIIDFVWVAVLDDRTGEFDAWADGKLTSDIRDGIDNGEAPESEYESEVPPAHFNCRCTMAPATEELSEQIPESNAEDFESWLNS